MKFRMLSLLSIILVLTIKSLEISAKDYHELRVLARAIPPSPYVPSIVPFEDFSEKVNHHRHVVISGGNLGKHA